MDNDIRNNVMNNLYNLRIESGMSQTQFGEIFGKKKTTVATWEQGGSLPDIVTLYKIAEYFKKSMDYMFSNH